MNSKRREADILKRTRAKYAREFEDAFSGVVSRDDIDAKQAAGRGQR